MYEYEIMNKVTGEIEFIWGYNWKDAKRRHPKMDFSIWEIVMREWMG